MLQVNDKMCKSTKANVANYVTYLDFSKIDFVQFSVLLHATSMQT